MNINVKISAHTVDSWHLMRFSLDAYSPVQVSLTNLSPSLVRRKSASQDRRSLPSKLISKYLSSTSTTACVRSMKCWGGKGTTLVVDASLDAFTRVRQAEEEFTPLGILGRTEKLRMEERQMERFRGNQSRCGKDCTTRSLSPSQRLALFLVGDEDDWKENQVPDEDLSKKIVLNSNFKKS